MTTHQELTALAALTFNWTSALDDVWAPMPYHVEGLHAEAAALIERSLAEASASVEGSRPPLGVVLQGERGVGKTHLLGWARVQVQRAGGYFFLVGDLSTKGFWEQVLGTVVEQLLPFSDGSRDQLGSLLARLADRTGLDGVFRAGVTGQAPPTPETLKVFIAALRRTYPSLGMTCQETARALVLLASPLQEDQDVGYFFLTGSEVTAQDRRPWGIYTQRKEPRLLVAELFKLLALTGPTVLAIDQIDALIDELAGPLDEGTATRSRPLADVATGLMRLRDYTRRTLTVLSCLPESWTYLRKYGTDTVADRFHAARQLRNLPSAEIARVMVEKRFAADYARVGCQPPYPTWPVLPAAFDDALRYTARSLLKRIEAHVSACLRDGAVTELGWLDAGTPSSFASPSFASPSLTSPLTSSPLTSSPLTLPAAPVPAVSAAAGAAVDAAAAGDFAALDAAFAELRDRAEVSGALAQDTEDSLMPTLLAAGIEAWVRELGGEAGDAFVQDPQPGRNPRLHASLRMILDPRTERQCRWAFRAIAADHPRAVQSRLRKATEAMPDAGEPGRELFVLRNTGWPNGPVTERETAAFAAKGGVVLPVTAEDLRTFSALGELARGRHPELNAWLAARRPAHATELFRQALGTAGQPLVPGTVAPRRASQAPVTPTAPDTTAAAPTAIAAPTATATPIAPVAPVARSVSDASPASAALVAPHVPAAIRLGLPEDGQPGAVLDLASLRRHLAIFAGSGSGKTVLLRRVIEECALHGVSSIVLDPGNDLARLGEPWPAPPGPWLEGDAERARDYLAGTDVVVWTPRRASGRPLTFQPLPDFGAVLDEADEVDAAIEAAVEALAPRIGAHRDTPKSRQEKAVLTEAMRYFARGAGRDLGAFIGKLDALPEHVTAQHAGVRIAAELADRLRAVRTTDPLFGGPGEPADPGMLLTPPQGKRARVSVISSVGMTSLDQWQGFVNQLQMALFSWVRRNPAEDRPLSALLVMDEAQDLVPSIGVTPCSESTRRLAAQARKYGLGLLFATQSPKSLHNSVPGNATTQLFGLLSAPAQIGAARELARARGSSLPDIGRLSAGQFYLAAEGSGCRLIRTPMCLSQHPAGPLTEEEVLARAAGASPQ